MRSDLYIKFILTVIALALLRIAVWGPPVPVAAAQPLNIPVPLPVVVTQPVWVKNFDPSTGHREPPLLVGVVGPVTTKPATGDKKPGQ
jgi:hypothetical protein